MSKIVLHYLLPLALPTLAYVAWVLYYQKRVAASGKPPPEITRTGLFISLIAGLVLVIAGMVTLAITTGEPPGTGKYQSPRFEDGRIVPPSYGN